MNSRNVATIIPAYITSETELEWLDECLDSVVGQGCLVSLHDDGSIIDIGKVTGKYSKRIMLSRSDVNNGVSHARNEAVGRVPDNALIFPLDCDDTIKDGAIDKLVSIWEGIPVYPDVAKFGDETIEHYVLLEWSCSHLLQFVGYTSVNVLHSKSQWKSIGGWNEKLDFYEDGEYNARLFGTYCARRFPEPLVNYRIHVGQRTKKYAGKSKMYANKILESVRRLDMSCPGCGGRRSAPTTSSRSVSTASRISGNRGENIMVNNANLPIEFEGKVLATYEGGKGKGKHYYQGIGSKSFYKNVQFGDLVYADPRDVKRKSDIGSVSKLVLVERAQPSAPQPSAPPPIAAPATSEPVKASPSVAAKTDAVVTKTPKLAVEKSPVVVEEEEEVTGEEFSTMQIKDIKELDLSCEDAKELIKIEKFGSNRASVIKYLKSLCS